MVLRVAFAAALIVGHGWGKLGTLLEGGGAGFPDPFGERELAFVYLIAFVTLFFTGPGRYSLGKLIRGK